MGKSRASAPQTEHCDVREVEHRRACAQVHPPAASTARLIKCPCAVQSAAARFVLTRRMQSQVVPASTIPNVIDAASQTIQAEKASTFCSMPVVPAPGAAQSNCHLFRRSRRLLLQQLLLTTATTTTTTTKTTTATTTTATTTTNNNNK